MVDLSIVIPSYNTKELTINCIQSIVKHTKGIKYEIIIIDNASTDGSQEAIKKYIKNLPAGKAGLKLKINSVNIGFAAANNIGIKHAEGKYILFLNSDTVIHNNLFPEIINYMKNNPKIGAISCMLKNKNGSIQETGGYFPTLPRVFSWMLIQDIPFVDLFIKPFHPDINFYKKERELDWLTGAFILTRKEILKKIKPESADKTVWDEKYFMYTEDVDLCFKIKKFGFKIVYLPSRDITHFGGASGTREKTVLLEFEGVKRFYKKHYPSWQYPALRFILKLGCLPRIIISPKIYVKAFIQV